MSIKIINVFAVPQVEDFLKRCSEATQVFIETHLHRNTGVSNQTVNFINIAY